MGFKNGEEMNGVIQAELSSYLSIFIPGGHG
jgi:hypothetical protein